MHRPASRASVVSFKKENSMHRHRSTTLKPLIWHRRALRAVLLCLLCVMGAGCAVGGTPSQAGGAPQAGVVAPDFGYELSDGTAQRLSDARGKTVIVNFWATWCVPCREEMPILQSVATTYSDRVLVLGVNSYDDADAIRAYADELGVTFPLVRDPTGDVGEQYRVQVLPITVIIDPEGVVQRIVRGPVDRRTLEDELTATVSSAQP
jgi:cytochrome c biogenesis protein CcmG, thiol:disulfide interchange protein DsbE